MTNSLTINDLTKTVKESNLPASKAEALEAAFMPFFEQAAKHCETAFTIKVTNIGQTAEMGRAKQVWTALKDNRIAKEKMRVRVKEDALKEGRAIDKIANFLDSVTVPMEKYLEDQWKYGERMQQAAQAEARQWREIEAGDLIKYFPAGIDLGTIADEEFAKHLHLAGVQFKAIQDENARIENERIERERREAAEKEAMRVENERLKAEAAKVEAERTKEREAIERIQREQAAKWEAERNEKDRLLREAYEKEQAEKQRIEADNRRKEEAEKAALSASDKVKIEAIIAEIKKVNIPEFAVKGSKQRVFSLIFDLEIELLKIVE